jgi:hypothetical protein
MKCALERRPAREIGSGFVLDLASLPDLRTCGTQEITKVTRKPEEVRFTLESGRVVVCRPDDRVVCGEVE